MSAFSESVVEDAALAWLESLGYTVKHGLEIAPGELAAERTDYGEVVLERRLRDALARLNPVMGDGHVNMQFPLSPGRYCSLSSTATCSPWGGTQRTYESHFRRPRRRSDGPGRFASVTEEPSSRCGARRISLCNDGVRL